jgi:curved DNA-binding protein CbpA
MDASADEIHQAYRKRAKTMYSEKGLPEAYLQRLNLAFETLRDAGRRAKYDAQLRSRSDVPDAEFFDPEAVEEEERRARYRDLSAQLRKSLSSFRTFEYDGFRVQTALREELAALEDRCSKRDRLAASGVTPAVVSAAESDLGSLRDLWSVFKARFGTELRTQWSRTSAAVAANAAAQQLAAFERRFADQEQRLRSKSPSGDGFEGWRFGCGCFFVLGGGSGLIMNLFRIGAQQTYEGLGPTYQGPDPMLVFFFIWGAVFLTGVFLWFADSLARWADDVRLRRFEQKSQRERSVLRADAARATSAAEDAWQPSKRKTEALKKTAPPV